MKKLFIFLLLGIFLLNFGSSAMADNIRMYLPHNDTAQTNPTDLTGNVTNGLIFQTTRGNAGIFDLSYTYGGNTSSYTNMSYSIPTFNETTITMWVYPTSVGTGNMIAKQLTSVTQGYVFRKNGTNFLQLEVANTQTITANTSSTLPINQWSFIAVTFGNAGQRAKMYRNGVLASDTLQTTSQGAATNSPITLGIRAWSGAEEPYTGRIDEVGYWNRTLTGAEILQLYNSGVGWQYPFNSVVVTLNAPANNSNNVANSALTFNWTSTANVGSLVNSTLFINDSPNETISVTGTSNITTTSKIISTSGRYSWVVTSCTSTFCTNSSRQFFNISSVIVNSVTYSSTIAEGISNNFLANLSLAPLLGLSSAYLNYNGTNYSTITSSLGNNYYLLNVSLVSPLVTGSTNYTFFYHIGLNDSTTFLSGNYYQIVSDFAIGSCSSYNQTLYNFTIVDEDSQTKINASNSSYAAGTFTLYTAAGVLMSNYSAAYNNTNPFQVCISNNSLQSNESFLIDAIVQYKANGYATEFYNIRDQVLNSSLIYTNITLYDLNSSVAQEFLVTFTDENFNPVSDALITVTRKYISEGIFKTVEIPITDANGEAITNLRLSDTIYTFKVYKNGILLATFENQVAFCDNIATGDCTIPLNTYSSTIVPSTFENVDDYTFNIAYNKTTRVITASFGIPSGTAATSLFNVTVLSNSGSTAVCSSTLLTSSGTFTCTVPASYQNNTLLVELSKNGNKVGALALDQSPTPESLYGASRVFLSIAIFLLLIGIGLADSPMVYGVFLIIGSIGLLWINLVDKVSYLGATSAIIWFVVAVVLVLVKGARR